MYKIPKNYIVDIYERTIWGDYHKSSSESFDRDFKAIDFAKKKERNGCHAHIRQIFDIVDWR